MTDKDTVLGIVRDLVGDFLYYDRKNSQNCPLGAIEDLVQAGDLTVDEIIEEFQTELRKHMR